MLSSPNPIFSESSLVLVRHIKTASLNVLVFAIARTMIVDASLPPQFWGEAVITTTYPQPMRFGRRPDLRHPRPFRITCFARIQKHLTKIQPRALKGILLGYMSQCPPKRATAVTFSNDLESSLASRDPSMLSSRPPVFVPRCPTVHAHDPATVPSPSVSLPCFSYRENYRCCPTTPPPTRSSTPTSAPTAPTVQTPRLSPHPQQAKWSPTISPIITTPIVPGPGEPSATAVAKVRRPPGRPPRNSRWDPNQGRHVPILVTNYHRVWCAVADSTPSPVCPTTYHQATTGPDSKKWKQAIHSKITSLRECETAPF